MLGNPPRKCGPWVVSVGGTSMKGACWVSMDVVCGGHEIVCLFMLGKSLGGWIDGLGVVELEMQYKASDDVLSIRVEGYKVWWSGFENVSVLDGKRCMCRMRAGLFARIRRYGVVLLSGRRI